MFKVPAKTKNIRYSIQLTRNVDIVILWLLLRWPVYFRQLFHRTEGLQIFWLIFVFAHIIQPYSCNHWQVRSFISAIFSTFLKLFEIGTDTWSKRWKRMRGHGNIYVPLFAFSYIYVRGHFRNLPISCAQNTITKLYDNFWQFYNNFQEFKFSSCLSPAWSPVLHMYDHPMSKKHSKISN